MTSQGSIKQIFGPVVDVAFEGDLPGINDAVEPRREGSIAVIGQELGAAATEATWHD